MIQIDRKRVKKQINESTRDELIAWRKHAVRCLDYFVKARNEFEIEECHFVISHIDQKLKEMDKEKE